MDEEEARAADSAEIQELMARYREGKIGVPVITQEMIDQATAPRCNAKFGNERREACLKALGHTGEHSSDVVQIGMEHLREWGEKPDEERAEVIGRLDQEIRDVFDRAEDREFLPGGIVNPGYPVMMHDDGSWHTIREDLPTVTWPAAEGQPPIVVHPNPGADRHELIDAINSRWDVRLAEFATVLKDDEIVTEEVDDGGPEDSDDRSVLARKTIAEIVQETAIMQVDTMVKAVRCIAEAQWWRARQGKKVWDAIDDLRKLANELRGLGYEDVDTTNVQLPNSPQRDGETAD